MDLIRDYIELLECLRYVVLTEAPSRTNFLVTTYGAKLDAKWQADMATEPAVILNTVQGMPGDSIAQKLVNYIQSFDPSSNNQYTQWMVQRYLKAGLTLQNLPSTKEYLSLFNTMKTKKQLPDGQADINAYQNYDNFMQGMRQHRPRLLVAKLEKKWKATGAREPLNVQTAIMAQHGKTIGDKILSYLKSFDPSHGHHVYWLSYTWLTNGLRFEDLEAARDDLQAFDKLTTSGTLNLDLDTITSLAQLASLVRKPDSAAEHEIVDNEEAKMLAQTKVLLDDDFVRIVMPLTRTAACYFGRNTDWCTAWGSHVDLGLSKEGRYPSRTNQFDYYSNQGPLYIIEIKPETDLAGTITKKRKLYQYHTETGQFANPKDQMLSRKRVRELLEDFPEIKEAIGEPLANASELFDKYGMTEQVIAKIRNSLADGLGIGTYDAENKRFIINSWPNFGQFIDGIYDENVKEILAIAMGKSILQDRGDVDEEFINAALAMPPQLQEKLLDRAGVDTKSLSDDLIADAAKRLIPHDEWYTLFKELYDSTEQIKREAWERLAEYAAIGWIFVGDGLYTNVPNGQEIEQFASTNQEVHLYLDQRDMLQYADVGEGDFGLGDDGDSDSEYSYAIAKMKEGDDTADWETLDAQYMREQRREAMLVNLSDDDPWLESKQGDDDSMLSQDFIDILQGVKPTPQIKDPRQQELNLESIRRLRRLAGILQG